MSVSPASRMVLATFVVFATFHLAASWQVNQGKIPNGAGLPNFPGVGHVNPQGSGALNAFGNAFLAAGQVWTQALCQADSDGDGQSNGLELGDPCCIWTTNAAPMRSDQLSHPGLNSSITTALPPSCVPTTTAKPTTTKKVTTTTKKATTTTKKGATTTKKTTTTTKKATTTVACKDLLSTCATLRDNNLCTTSVVQTNCKLTCGLCTGTLPATTVATAGPTSACGDTWLSTNCVNFIASCSTVDVVRTNCKRTCNLCPAVTGTTTTVKTTTILTTTVKTTTPAPTTTTKTTTPSPTPTQSCTDQWTTYCAGYTALCVTSTYVQQNCRRTCNLCPAGTDAPTASTSKTTTKATTATATTAKPTTTAASCSDQWLTCIDSIIPKFGCSDTVKPFCKQSCNAC